MGAFNLRQQSIRTVRIDYATNGKDSGAATIAYINGGISRATYREAATIGLNQFKDRVMELNKLTGNKEVAEQVAKLGLSITQSEQVINLLSSIQEEQISLCVNRLDHNSPQWRENIIKNMDRVIKIPNA